MLYLSSLVALVGSGDQAGSSPRKLQLWNTQKQVYESPSLAFISILLIITGNNMRNVISFHYPDSSHEQATTYYMF
jgi:hypothetical protein